MNTNEKIAIIGKAAVFPEGEFGRRFSSQATGDEISVPIKRKIKRDMSASLPCAIKVSEYAFHSAGVNPLDQKHNIGIYAGQYGYLHPHLEEFLPVFNKTLPGSKQSAFKDAWESSNINPFIITYILNNNLLGLMSLHWGISGDCAALVRDNLSAITVIQEAVFSLKQHNCDIALAICAGAESDWLTADLKGGCTREIQLDEPKVGAVAFVLKRLLRAEKDGDVVDGVIDTVVRGNSLEQLIQRIRAQNSNFPHVICDFALENDSRSFETLLQADNNYKLENLSEIKGERGCPGLMAVLFASLTKKTTNQALNLAVSGSEDQHYGAIFIHRRN